MYQRLFHVLSSPSTLRSLGASERCSFHDVAECLDGSVLVSGTYAKISAMEPCTAWFFSFTEAGAFIVFVSQQLFTTEKPVFAHCDGVVALEIKKKHTRKEIWVETLLSRMKLLFWEESEVTFP